MNAPLPQPSELSRPFWQACRRGELVVLTCRACRARIHPPLPACPVCRSEDLMWERCTGRGTVYSYTVMHRAPFPGADVPSILVIVELDEGHTMLSRLVECDPAAVAVDTAVEVVFVPQTDAISLPLFRPRSGDGIASRST